MNNTEKILRPGLDFIGVNVVFYCHDGRGNLLFHLRSDKCWDEHNRWDVGGGRVNFGEELEEAVCREVMEEYGCEALVIEHFLQINVLRQHDGRQTHWLANLYLVQVDPAATLIMEPERSLELCWADLDSLPQPLHSIFEKVANEHGDLLRQKLNSSIRAKL